MITEYREERHDFGKEDLGNPPPGVMFVFVEDGAVVFVDFLCPCGCGRTCPTPVTDASKGQPKTKRYWLYAPGPTLTPSIRYTGGCKVHFNITNGKVIIHGDSGS